MPRKPNPLTKSHLLEAAFAVIRTKGYSATTVDDICTAAKLSKGRFSIIFPARKIWPSRLPTIGRK